MYIVHHTSYKTFVVNHGPLFKGCLHKTFDLYIKEINYTVDTFEVNNGPGYRVIKFMKINEILIKDWIPFLWSMVMDEFPPGPFYDRFYDDW